MIMQLSSRWIRWFGRLSLGIAIVAALSTLLGIYPQEKSLDGYLFALGLMALVSGALIVAAQLKDKNDPLAEKVVPSSVVAYLLFIVMTIHWLSN